MFRKIGLPLLALIGIGFAIFAAIRGARTIPAAAPVAEPPQAPYRFFVAGTGLVETNTENISVGTHIPGVVTSIYVQIGSQVTAGQPLFTIDDRTQRAVVDVRKAALQYAKAQLADAQYQLALGERLTSKQVLSIEERNTRQYAAQKAEAQVAQAKADLETAQTDLERLTVRAPVSGEVIQMKLHLGEYAPAGALSSPLLLLGGTRPLHVRTDVDENEAWRVRPEAPALGYLRGNKQINTRLQFVRFEPYVVPKVSLTGESTERVDTRVLQVIYSFEKEDLPIYVGQQMDVYIEAPGHPQNR